MVPAVCGGETIFIASADEPATCDESATLSSFSSIVPELSGSNMSKTSISRCAP